jgi:dipeptidyl aminopeptidase/acylaminoacyl peptidase
MAVGKSFAEHRLSPSTPNSQKTGSHQGSAGKSQFPFALFLCLCLSAPRITYSQEADVLRVEDVVGADRFAQLMPIAVAPDGKSVAYAVQEKHRLRIVNSEAYFLTGVPPWGSGTDIFVLSTSSGETRNLTSGKGDNWLPTWSPDGRYLAFFSDRDDDGARLWVWDIVKDELKRVSDVKVHSEQIEWTPDGRNVVIGVAGPRSARKEQAKDDPTAETQNAKSSELLHDTAIVYGGGKASMKDKDDPESDPWNLNLALRDLVSIHIATGKITVLVTGNKISTYLISPDGSQIAYTVPERFEKAGSQQIVFNVAVVDSHASKKRTIASGLRMDHDGSSFSWSPDGKQLSFQTGGMAEEAYDCYLVDVRTALSRNLTKFRTSSQSSRHKSVKPLWGAKDENIYFLRGGALWRVDANTSKSEEVAHIPNHQITQMIQRSNSQLWELGIGQSTVVVAHDDLGKQDGFYRIDLVTGESSTLLERGECYTCANVTEKYAVVCEGRFVIYFSESAGKDVDLWIAPSGFQNPKQLTHLNPQFEKSRLGAARLIDWLSDDGERLHGALLLPPGYQENKRYPLVVWVYGGVLLSDRFDHFGLGYTGPFNLQLLAAQGYAVLLPDAPLRAGTPMLDLAKTVLPGVNKAIEMGIASPDHVGIIGHSFGGYSVLALIVQTTRFKAAIVVDGYGDLLGHYGEMSDDGTAFGTSLEEHGQGLMVGPPWELPMRYMENSPILHLDRIETPLLVVHGGSDDDIRPFLGDEIFVGLRRLGKTVEFVKYRGEGHSPTDWSSANQVDLSNRVISWLNTNLKR